MHNFRGLNWPWPLCRMKECSSPKKYTHTRCCTRSTMSLPVGYTFPACPFCLLVHHWTQFCWIGRWIHVSKSKTMSDFMLKDVFSICFKGAVKRCRGGLPIAAMYPHVSCTRFSNTESSKLFVERCIHLIYGPQVYRDMWDMHIGFNGIPRPSVRVHECSRSKRMILTAKSFEVEIEPCRVH
jgi:hypothetical protein